MTNTVGNRFSNQSDYPLLREFLWQLLRTDPFAHYGAHGIGIGRKAVAGKPTDSLAVRFHVDHKLPLDGLPPEQRIPDRFRYRSQQSDSEVELVTDVVEASPGRPHTDPEARLRPVPGGASCSGYGDMWPGTGTLGGWVWDNTDNTIVMLSNQHVFGNVTGTPVLQPGSADGGVFPGDRIGMVKRSITLTTAPADIRQAVYPNDCNFVDAAIAELDDSDHFDLTVLEIGPAVYEVADPLVGMSVEKFGQTTGHTVGEISDFPYHTVLSYPIEGDVIMCDCFRYETSDPAQLPLSASGDSGAIVFRQDTASVFKAAVGLLFAGGTQANNNWSVACPITSVFDALDLGPLCIAGCAAFVDALYADTAEAEEEGDRLVMGISPVVFTSRERQRARRFHTGLTLDVQRRFLSSQRGRAVISFINRHRSELMTLVVNDGDTRRALVGALRPILVGAVTTTDVLTRQLREPEVERLRKLFAIGRSKGSASFRKCVKVLQSLLDGAEGRSLAQVLRIRLSDEAQSN